MQMYDEREIEIHVKSVKRLKEKRRCHVTISQKKKEYYKNNKEVRAEYNKENKENISKQQAQYYNENKETISHKKAQ